MKEITLEEVAPISVEIHEAAARVGCTHVRITNYIYPGGKTVGPPEDAARFVEYSWYQAALVKGRAVFDDVDPEGYAALLQQYGLGVMVGDEATPRREESGVPVPTPTQISNAGTLQLTCEVLPTTHKELERQARVRGISVGQLLDEKCAYEMRYR